MVDTNKTVTYRAKGNTYVYSVINDIPAEKSCVGMFVSTLCWGKAIIVKYKNAKSIDILFLDSGNVETVQKAALEVGNVADSIMREYLNNKKKDEAVIEACKKQQKKFSEKIRKAHKRIMSRNSNRKVRLEKMMELYKDVIPRLEYVLTKGTTDESKTNTITST